MGKIILSIVLLALGCTLTASQPFLTGQTLLPLGNLRTVDNSGPFNLSLLSVQANEVKAGIAARMNFTDRDIINFLVNVECLEGLFDTWGAFGRGFLNDLEKGGPQPLFGPLGPRGAKLSEAVRPFMEEVALNEQGHALFTRHAGSSLPCPQVDFDGGFNKWLGAAYGLTGNETIESRFGAAFDPFKNDQNFVLSVLTLEELGATGNKGLIGLLVNPVLANGVAGLATSACSQAAVERMLLWQMRNYTVEPFNETVQQVFARVSALRDALDGPQQDDQGLVNTDPRYIAVPDQWVNMIPTDVRGLTLNRSPQMLINILTLGNPQGLGVFFPNGLVGNITTPMGYNITASGLEGFPANPKVASQESVAAVGTISSPINGTTPATVPGVLDLTQGINGPLEDSSPNTRGYIYTPSGTPYNGSSSDPPVAVGRRKLRMHF